MPTWRDSLFSVGSGGSGGSHNGDDGLRDRRATDAKPLFNKQATSNSLARKSLMDEQEKMNEKRKAFEVKQRQQYLLDITNGNERRLYAADLLERAEYQFLMTLFTFLSVGVVAREADNHSSGDERSAALFLVDVTLIVAFALDMLARVYVYQSSFAYTLMNVFEFVLLVIDITLQFWNSLPRIAKALKILRFVRMMRILRKLSALRELYLMMMGIAASIRAIGFGAALLFLTTTIFSVLSVYFVAPVCRELAEEGVFNDCDFCAGAFDSVMEANLTFFVTIMTGDSWGRLFTPIVRRDVTAGGIVLSAWVVLALGLLNTIAAVIVDRQTQARVQDADYMAELEAEEMFSSVQHLENMFKEFDGLDEDTVLSQEKVVKIYDENAGFRALLNRLDVHRPHVPVLFRMFDTDGTDDLTIPEFVHGLHNLRNENLRTVAIFTKYYAETLLERWTDIEEVRTMIQDQDKKFQRVCKKIEAALRQPAKDKSIERAEAVKSNGHRSLHDCCNGAKSEAEPVSSSLLFDAKIVDGSLCEPGLQEELTTDVQDATTSARQSRSNSQCSSEQASGPHEGMDEDDLLEATKGGVLQERLKYAPEVDPDAMSNQVVDIALALVDEADGQSTSAQSIFFGKVSSILAMDRLSRTQQLPPGTPPPEDVTL
eukprot:TRINITY_DN11216_c0_g4_i1.p1 TRINITY_DN11216_c0_g4~~TRINITY_DN11216_c0_g4_i1.p1  ORF type:complete len:657 (-),score=159.66 TRINITY_DN11216_c0_g4_i1:556-2526(-)